jgi:hypothetical protein
MSRVAQNILNHMEAGGSFQGVYVLGCFAKHLTIYSQQVRALNLVKALIKNNRVQPNDEIVVIGAGIAGTTCAIAAVKMGLKVKLLENKYEQPMGLQTISQHRYVHPHIYEWPLPESYNSDAGLPIMNWQANVASKVIKQLKDYWDDFHSKHLDAVSFVKVDGYPIIEDNVDEDGLRSVGYKVRNGKNETKPFKAVILSVGFGVENEDQYWSTGDYSHVVNGDKVLISGNGDGALTDLMAVLFESFNHQDFLNFIKNDKQAIELGNKVLDLEKQGKSSEILKLFQGTSLDNFQRLFEPVFANKNDKPNISDLKESPNSAHPDLNKSIVSLKNIKIHINGSLKSLYASKSSILNRLIFSQLLKHITVLEKKYHIEIKERDGSVNVSFMIDKKNMWDDKFDLVIMRHGPVPVLTPDSPAYGDIYTSCNHFNKRFENYTYQTDPTLEKIYKHSDFETEPDFNESENLSIEIKDELNNFWKLPYIGHERAYILSNWRPSKKFRTSQNEYYRISDFEDRDSVVEALTFLARVNRNHKILKVPYPFFNKDKPQSDLILLGGPISADGREQNLIVKEVNETYLKGFSFEKSSNNEYALCLEDRRFETIRKTEYNKSTAITEDWGVIYRCVNPWNENARILSFQGVEVPGTLGAIYAMSYPKVAGENAHLIGEAVNDPTDPLFYAIVKIHIIDGVVEPPVLNKELIFPL